MHNIKVGQLRKSSNSMSLYIVLADATYHGYFSLHSIARWSIHLVNGTRNEIWLQEDIEDDILVCDANE